MIYNVFNGCVLDCIGLYKQIFKLCFPVLSLVGFELTVSAEMRNSAKILDYFLYDFWALKPFQDFKILMARFQDFKAEYLTLIMLKI